MPTMFQHPYQNKSFNGDLSQLPPRSASASCKSSGPFFTDTSKYVSFVDHRNLFSHSKEGVLSSQEESEFGLGRFASRSKKFFNSNYELSEDNYNDTLSSGLKAVRNPVYSSDDLILSELLSITRPEGATSESNVFRSADISGNEFAQTGNAAWFSHQTVQELADLRNDFTPRLLRGLSKKTSLPAARSPWVNNSLSEPTSTPTSQEKSD